jgi:hypothetical protein
VRRLLVTASVVPSSPIIVTLMIDALSYSESSVLARASQCNIPEDDILHIHHRDNLKSYIPVGLCSVDVMLPVRYELGCYITEDVILHSHRRENPKSYIALTGWAL